MPIEELARATAFRFVTQDSRLWAGKVIQHLERELSRANIARPMVVTSSSLARDSETMSAIASAFGNRPGCIYSGVAPDSPLDAVEGALELAKRSECDGIVALGGGSAIVTSRAICMSVRAAERGGASFQPLDIPYVVIPSTPTTAMARLGAAVTLEDGHRLELFDPSAVPSAVLIDSDLLGRTPDHVFLDSAIATFANAVEQMTTPSLAPLAHADFREAVDLSAAALSGWVIGGGGINEDRRSHLAVAAYLCGRASASDVPRQATVGLALGHAIQRHRSGVSHGVAMASALVLGLSINAAAAAAGQRELLGVLQPYVAASNLSDAIGKVLNRLGYPTTIRDIGLRQADLRSMAPVLMESHFVRTNIREFADLEELEAALALAT